VVDFIAAKRRLEAMQALHPKAREYVYRPGTFEPLVLIDKSAEVPHGSAKPVSVPAVPPVQDNVPVRQPAAAAGLGQGGLGLGGGMSLGEAPAGAGAQTAASAPPATPQTSGESTTTSGLFYYHNDPNGCPTRLTSATGQTVWAASYTAWGQVEKLHVSLVQQPIRLQGQHGDDETGLVYNRSRYYEPVVGQFASQDPLGLMPGPNLYRFGRNTLGWADPLGLTPVKPGDAGAFGDLGGEVGDMLTPHHMPQDALGFLPRNEGGAIVLPHAEHVQTRTYGPKGRATKALDAGRPFKDVLIDDIHDLRRIADDKYDDSIEKLIKYYETKGMLQAGEIDLKKICRA
jgi:RHS repeat-associated protein